MGDARRLDARLQNNESPVGDERERVVQLGDCTRIVTHRVEQARTRGRSFVILICVTRARGDLTICDEIAFSTSLSRPLLRAFPSAGRLQRSRLLLKDRTLILVKRKEKNN